MTRLADSSPQLDPTIAAWLELGPSELADRVIEQARADVHRTPQRRRWLPGWSTQSRERFHLAIAFGVAAILLAVVTVGLLASLPSVGTAPAPSPSPRLTGVFQTTGSMTVGRSGHTAALLDDGRVLIVGGSAEVGGGDPARAGSGGLASAEVYDPTTGKFTLAGPMAEQRFEHTATLLPNGLVLVAGGKSGGADGVPLASAELYDPASGRFLPTGRMAAGRASASAILLGDGRVLVAAGGGDGFDPLLYSAELYDPTAGTFSSAGPMTGNGPIASVVRLGDGRVLFVGSRYAGETPPGVTYTEIFDPATASFTVGPVPAIGPGYSIAALLHDGRILLVGGTGRPLEPTGAAELFDPLLGSFGSTGVPLDAQVRHAVTLHDGRVLILGVSGRVDAVPQAPFAELYDPVASTFSATGALPAARIGETMTLLRDGQVLVAGGGTNTAASPAFSTAEVFR
jgi:hypothetical protein